MKKSVFASIAFAVLLLAAIAFSVNASDTSNSIYTYGFYPRTTTTQTATYTVLTSDEQVNMNCTDNCGATMPTINSTNFQGAKVYRIVKVDSGTGIVSIYPATGQTINGSSNPVTLSTQYAAAIMSISNAGGTDWTLVNTNSTATAFSLSTTTVNTAAGALNGDGTTDFTLITPYAGTLTAAYFSAGTTVNVGDTNYLTFTITNLGQAGANAEAMLAAGNVNKTNTGGSNVKADALRTLTISTASGRNATTASPLDVRAGDRLRMRCAGVNLGPVLNPSYTLKFTGR